MAHTADKAAQEIVMQKLNSERGMSLVEATIILMVLAILTSVLAPSLGDYVNDARQTKAKEDVEALGTSIMRLLRDTGKPFPLVDPSLTLADTNRADLMVSEGSAPTAEGTGTALNAAGYFVEAALEWDDAIGGNVVSATSHLITNAANYDEVLFPASGGPKPGLGWRGGYLSTSTGPDPWGTRYACTTVWLNPSSNSVTKGTNNDAFCLSAGADTVADTNMESTNGGAVVEGDDLVFVFQGATR